MRKPRNANRGSIQSIEDQFADLELNQQERVLETLTSLNRWCKRERSRKEVPLVVTDPATNAALLLGGDAQ